MNILIAILLILNLSAVVYFIGTFYERTWKLKRDMDAIAARLRAMEEVNQVLQVANDFRIKVMEQKVFGGDDTGFDLNHLIKKK